MKGWIYILSNPSFSGGQIKIGKTAKHPSERASELFTTGLPTPFYLEYTALVANHDDVELRVHSALSAYRPSNHESFSREFFTCGVPAAISVIREISEIFHEEIHYKSPGEIAQEEATRAFENDVAKIEEQFEEEVRCIDDAHQNKILELSGRISGPSSVKQKMWLTWGAGALLSIPTSGISLVGALFLTPRLDDLDQAKFDAEEAEKQQEKLTKQWEVNKKEAEARKRKALLKLEHAHDDQIRRLGRREKNTAVTDKALSTKQDEAAAVSTTANTVTSVSETINDHVNHPAHPNFNEKKSSNIETKKASAINRRTGIAHPHRKSLLNQDGRTHKHEKNSSGESVTIDTNSRKPVKTLLTATRLPQRNTKGTIGFTCGSCNSIVTVEEQSEISCTKCGQRFAIKKNLTMFVKR